MSDLSKWSQRELYDLAVGLVKAGLEPSLKEWLDRSGNASRAVTAIRALRRGTELVSVPRDRRIHIAADTRTGSARKRNEDSAHCFGAANVDFLLLADGLGGHDMGDRASQIAIRVGSAHLVQRLAEVGTDEYTLMSLLPETMFHINVELTREMLRLSLDPGRDALRTTCIISASTECYHLLSWIGDGGGWLRLADGSVKTLLEPHKGVRQNELDASLGAMLMSGAPSSVFVRRRPGDMLVVTTDGISDYLDVAEFVAELHHMITVEYGGNAQQAVRAMLDYLERHQRDGKFTFPDNISLGVVMTPCSA